MCNNSCIEFYKQVLKPEEICGKRILEVGSANLNGGLRSYIESFLPQEYIGVDIQQAPGVDIILKAEDLVKNFGENRFDIVVSTEVLEHIDDWISAINNIKKVCSHGGMLLLTTRSLGFPYHGYPYDYWRFSLQDFRRIFEDFEIINLESDKSEPGVFLYAKKPVHWSSYLDMSQYRIWSIISGKRESVVFAKQFESTLPDLNRLDYNVRRYISKLPTNLKRRFHEIFFSSKN